MRDLPARANSSLVIYESEDGRTRIQVRLDGQTVWLTQRQMAELFETTKQNVSLHIRNILGEGELPRSTVKEYLTVQRRPLRTRNHTNAARKARMESPMG